MQRNDHYLYKNFHAIPYVNLLQPMAWTAPFPWHCEARKGDGLDFILNDVFHGDTSSWNAHTCVNSYHVAILSVKMWIVWQHGKMHRCHCTSEIWEINERGFRLLKSNLEILRRKNFTTLLTFRSLIACLHLIRLSRLQSRRWFQFAWMKTPTIWGTRVSVPKIMKCSPTLAEL